MHGCDVGGEIGRHLPVSVAAGDVLNWLLRVLELGNALVVAQYQCQEECSCGMPVLEMAAASSVCDRPQSPELLLPPPVESTNCGFSHS